MSMKIDKLKVKQLFSNMCCSNCKSDFDENSITIVRKEEGLFIVKVMCNQCRKSFGLAFLGLDSIDLKKDYTQEDMLLNLQCGPDPINCDDVIKAHNFIKNLGHDWMKYIDKK